MMRWPGKLLAGKTYLHRVSTLDILPTCLEAAGIPAGPSAKLDGQSFLRAAKTGAPSPAVLALQRWWAVLSGEWRLVRSPDAGGPRAHQILYSGDSAGAKPALLNLTKDQAEQHDVSKANPAVVKRLTRLFENWRSEVRTEATKQ